MVRRRSAVAAIACAALVLMLLVVAARAGVALVVSRPITRPEVIVPLASHEWERLPSAARVARMNPGAIVLLTQPAAPTPENCNRCADRTAWLRWLGVPADRIAVAPRRVANTYDEAMAVREYCQRHRVERVLVVTSPYHTRRALATFDSVFAHSATTVGVAPAWLHSLALPDHWWGAPYDRWYVRYEWAGLMWYLVRHQVNPFVSTT